MEQNPKTPTDNQAVIDGEPSHFESPTIAPGVVDSSKEVSASGIRLKSIGLLIGMFVIPITILWVALWLQLVKHYGLSGSARAAILIVSGVVGPLIVLGGAIAGLDTYGSNYFVMVIGGIPTIAPFVFSFIKPTYEAKT
jgi:hypothetical protein